MFSRKEQEPKENVNRLLILHYQKETKNNNLKCYQRYYKGNSNIFDVTKGFSNGNIKLHISTNGRFIITK